MRQVSLPIFMLMYDVLYYVDHGIVNAISVNMSWPWPWHSVRHIRSVLGTAARYDLAAFPFGPFSARLWLAREKCIRQISSKHIRATTFAHDLNESLLYMIGMQSNAIFHF